MSGTILILIGLLLCLTGARSIRLAVLAAGFGAAWVVADALDASTSTALLVGASGAVIAFCVTLVVSKFMLFFVGAVVGAVIGAKLFVLLDGGDSSVLLAVVFVPAVSVLSGFLANRWSHTFLKWATAFGGAAIVITGLGRLAPDTLDALRAPDDVPGQVFLTVSWLALGFLGRAAQLRFSEKSEEARR